MFKLFTKMSQPRPPQTLPWFLLTASFLRPLMHLMLVFSKSMECLVQLHIPTDSCLAHSKIKKKNTEWMQAESLVQESWRAGWENHQHPIIRATGMKVWRTEWEEGRSKEITLRNTGIWEASGWRQAKRGNWKRKGSQKKNAFAEDWQGGNMTLSVL